MTTNGSIEIDLNTPNGPVVEYGPDDEIADVEIEIPAGWSVDWQTPAYKLASGRWRSPLVASATGEHLCHDSDCTRCDARAALRACSDCGATGIVTDCGHQAQPRPIAAGRVDGSDLSHDYCARCASRVDS